jgi:hypothetical protein
VCNAAQRSFLRYTFSQKSALLPNKHHRPRLVHHFSFLSVY